MTVGKRKETRKRGKARGRNLGQAVCSKIMAPDYRPKVEKGFARHIFRAVFKAVGFTDFGRAFFLKNNHPSKPEFAESTIFSPEKNGQ